MQIRSARRWWRFWQRLSTVKISSVVIRRLGQVVVILTVLAVLFSVWPERKLSRRELYLKIVESLLSVETKRELWQGRQACNRPEMDAFSSEMMRYIKHVGPLVCVGEKDWVEVDGNVASITAAAKRRHGRIDCEFTDIKRLSDYSVWPVTTVRSSDEHKFTASDFVRVHCLGQTGKTWSNILAGARYDLMDTGWDKVPEKGMKLNVLMFGFDSVSRLNFIRKLPKSYEYLTREMGALILDGYNIIGDGTPQAIIPILTGKTELELPEARKRKKGSFHVNAYPFVWNDFKDAGYVTGFMEDTPQFGIFSYRLKGFQNAPTDHYMRPFYLDAEQNYNSLFSDFCLGSRPRHKVMLDYVKSVFNVHKDRPKFVFGFHGEISHDDMNLVGAADLDLLEWLRWYSQGHKDNTILILMSDHGHRYGPSRATQQGKLEERLPFFSFTFPSWFEDVYPEAMKNFRTNVRRLTTPFDVHATLASILDPPSFGMGNLSHRGISLFQEVPAARTCVDAFIEPHWCACLEWQTFDKNDLIIRAAGEQLVTYINEYNAKYTDQCQLMGLRHVVWAAQLVPSEAFRKFRRSEDDDGLIPDMRGDTTVTTVMFQLQFVTDPGRALFEAPVTYDYRTGTFRFRIADVSRVNEYGNQARCVYNTFEHLRKFCFCKE